MAPKKASTKAAAAAPAATAADFKTGDVVLGKIKGYPDWPAKIMEHDTAPGSVAKVKGTRSILVRFFPDGDYMWAVPKEVKILSTKDIDAFLSDTSKKNGKLKTAYTIAKDPSEWEAEQEKKANEVGAEDEDEEDEDEDVDMLEEDGEAKPSKKRKRAAPAEKKEKKEKKETAPKAKKETAAAAKKRKTEESAGDKKPKSAAKGKAAPKDKKDAAKKEASAPADETSEGAKTVKGWRASLQKGFLTKGVPAGDKMPEFDSMFKAMEAFEMQAEWLAISKLGKVLKKMSVLEGIEREEEFKLKERCNALMDKWKEMLNKEGGDDVPAVAAAGGNEQVAGTGADAEANNGDLTMMDATAEDGEKKEGVNAEGQTNGEPEKKETNGSA